MSSQGSPMFPPPTTTYPVPHPTLHCRQSHSIHRHSHRKEGRGTHHARWLPQTQGRPTPTSLQTGDLGWRHTTPAQFHHPRRRESAWLRGTTRQTPEQSTMERWERLCLPVWVSQTTSTVAVRGGKQQSWACSPPTAVAGAWPAPWWWAGGCPRAFWACSCYRSAVVPAVAPAAAPAVSGSGGGRTRGISLPAWFAWVGGFAAPRNLAGPQLLRHQSYRMSLHP